METYPKWIEDKLQSMDIGDVPLVYFLIDSQGKIFNCGGQFEVLCLQRPKLNENIRDVLIFMEGFLPLEQLSLELPFITMETSVSVDVHLFPIENGYGLIVWDTTQKENDLRMIQQNRNEKQLSHCTDCKKIIE